MSSILIHTLELVLVSAFMYLAWLVLYLARSDANFESDARLSVATFDSSFKLSGLFLKPVKKQPSRSKRAEETAQFSKIDSLTRAQIFAGLQLFELKRSDINLDLANTKNWVTYRTSLFFIGACASICEHFDCDAEDRFDVCVFVLTRNMGMDRFDAEKLISEYRQARLQGKCDSADAEAYSAGIKAAGSWLDLRFTPKSECLSEQIQTWGFIG